MTGMPDLREALQALLRQPVLLNEPMSAHTWYRIGGPCDFYCYPENLPELRALVQWCQEQRYPYLVIGKGTNVLISDEGLRMLVIDLSKGFSAIRFDDNRCYVEAGVQVPKLVLECEKQGLGGLENFAGIPGSVGGALKMNAGCLGRSFYDFVEHITICDHGNIREMKNNQIEFHYRHVPLFDDPEIIALSAVLRLQSAEQSVLEKIRKESLEKRKNTQPIHHPSCGSVFKNPPGDFAGRLIEACGLKGYRHGGAAISELHANFIINEGNASAHDVLHIIRVIQKTIKEKFNIHLSPEVRLYGFRKEELAGVTD